MATKTEKDMEGAAAGDIEKCNEGSENKQDKGKGEGGSGGGKGRPAGRVGGSFGGLSVTSAPKFSGEGSFTRFLTDLEAFFAFDTSLDDEQRARFLPLCLTGVARDAYDSLTDVQRTTFEDAVEGLKGFFHRPNSVDAHSQLQSLKFEPREHHSFDVFLIKFRKLVHEAFPGSVNDIVLFNCFLDAVPERYKVDIVSQGITSFSGAVDRTRNVLRGEQLCANQTPGQSSVRQLTTDQPPVLQQTADQPSVLQQILIRLEQLERRVADADLPRRVPSRAAAARSGRGPGGPEHGSAGASSAPRGCYVCGSTGHLRRNCRFKNHTCYGCGETGHLVNRCPRTFSGSGNVQRSLEPGSRTRGSENRK